MVLLNGAGPYRRSDVDGQSAGEFGFEGGLAVLQYQREDFGEIGTEFIESFALCVGAGETGDVPDMETGVGRSCDIVRPRCQICGRRRVLRSCNC